MFITRIENDNSLNTSRYSSLLPPLLPDHSLILIPMVKRRDGLEPSADEFDARGAAGTMSVSVNFRWPNNKRMLHVPATCIVPLLLPKASPEGIASRTS